MGHMRAKMRCKAKGLSHGFTEEGVSTESSVRMKRKPEPYNGKGIRYAGEQITRKQGKAFGA